MALSGLAPVPAQAKSKTICDIMATEAERRQLPLLFFTRLIWKESQFHRHAVSPKGAQGIAQFMPETAKGWGLKDPFDPRQALPKSAQLLAHLRKTLGNLGLAAAGYNAGKLRVEAWLAGRAQLPYETRDYVHAITGWPADYWRTGNLPIVDIDTPTPSDVLKACKERKISLFSSQGRRDLGPWRPWGVQLAAHFVRAQALASYDRLRKLHPKQFKKQKIMVVGVRNLSRGRRLRFAIRLGAKNKTAASARCKKLRQANITCVVMKN